MPVTPDDGRPSEQDVEEASELAWKYSTNASSSSTTTTSLLVLVQVHAHRQDFLCVYI